VAVEFLESGCSVLKEVEVVWARQRNS